MGNLSLLISLIFIYLMLSIFGGLFGFKMGVINSLTGDSSYNENSVGLVDAADFIITFVALPFQALIDNELPVTLRIIMVVLGILNLVSLAFYIRGFI